MLVHSLDIAWPLGLTRRIPDARLRMSLTFLTSRRARGLVRKGALNGLRVAAEDLEWAHGEGPTVSGTAEALLLALTGRPAAFEHLQGEGVARLRSRLA